MDEDRTAAEDFLPRAPEDPRAHWDLPGFGAMPTVEVLADEVVRILAPNPSPMTLDGTNTYVIGARGTGEAVIVDPGPDLGPHADRVAAVLAQHDAAVRAIVLTHHHLDHAEAAEAWAAHHACPVLAASKDLHTGDRPLQDGDPVPLAGVEVSVVATPGHTRDHVSLRLGDGAVLTGDHVLGRGTSVIAHPDGDLEAYLASLRRLLDLGPAAMHPGHGPSLTEDPTAVLEFYRAHRRFREEQLLAALARGPATVDELVAWLYADVDRRVWPAAESSLRAAVEALARAERVREDVSGRLHLAGG